MVEKKRKDEADRVKALPIKAREEVVRFNSKLSGKSHPLFLFLLTLLTRISFNSSSGRQLFEKDSALLNSDAAFEEEGAIAVDISQYERPEGLEEEEVEARRDLGEISDDD